MPTYCYRREDGSPCEITMTAKEHSEREDADGHVVLANGDRLLRDFAAEHGQMRSGGKGWPMESEALACHPDQVREFTENARKHGVPTEFNTKTGCPIFTDPAHRRKYMKLAHVVDKKSYY